MATPAGAAGDEEVAGQLPPARTGECAGAVAHRCAEVAGAMLRAAAAVPRGVVAKGTTSGGRADLVTATDGAIERAVVAILAEAYPDHGVLGEETGAHVREAAWQWVIDPIDGTRNFSTGLPLVAFNLALYQGDTPRLALTLDPFREEVFYAETGRGTTLNGAPVQATAAGRLADTFLGVDIGLDDLRGRALLGILHALFPGVQALRIAGSAALGLAYVAAGRLDAYLHPSPFAWDFAPGVLLVQEAGGSVTELGGGAVTLASRSIIASGGGAHAELVERFREVGLV